MRKNAAASVLQRVVSWRAIRPKPASRTASARTMTRAATPARLPRAKLAPRARPPYVDLASAPDDVRSALERIPPLNVFRMVAHAETAFRPWLRFGGALLGAS